MSDIGAEQDGPGLVSWPFPGRERRGKGRLCWSGFGLSLILHSSSSSSSSSIDKGNSLGAPLLALSVSQAHLVLPPLPSLMCYVVVREEQQQQ